MEQQEIFRKLAEYAAANPDFLKALLTAAGAWDRARLRELIVEATLGAGILEQAVDEALKRYGQHGEGGIQESFKPGLEALHDVLWPD